MVIFDKIQDFRPKIEIYAENITLEEFLAKRLDFKEMSLIGWWSHSWMSNGCYMSFWVSYSYKRDLIYELFQILCCIGSYNLHFKVFCPNIPKGERNTPPPESLAMRGHKENALKQHLFGQNCSNKLSNWLLLIRTNTFQHYLGIWNINLGHQRCF